MSSAISFLLNDRDVSLDAFAPTDTLLDFIRLNRHLTGTKEGCAEGDCGACTVLIGRMLDGRLTYETVNACIRLLGSLHGTHIVTVEHLAAKDGTLHPVQQAMVDYHGSQCGFCTPGFVMSLYGLWLSSSAPSRADIERALQGNLCRCTGYEPIVKAAEAIASQRPSSLFDPIERERSGISAKLWAMAKTETITVEKDGKRSIIPHSVESLAKIYGAEEKATIVAGSTDVGLWVTKQFRDINPVIFINGLTELQTIRESDKGLKIGAGVTYAQSLKLLGQHYPSFGRVIDRIGGAQVRNMGTIGGNIANGSPIGDTPPVLIALGAELCLCSSQGTRRIALEDYFIEYGKQDRQKGEFVESVLVPKLEDDAHFAVYKISKRREEDISALCAAFHLTLSDNGTVTSFKAAFGGMAGTPKRAAALEAAVIGRPWTQELIDEVADCLDEDFTPLSDWRASAQYRSLVAKNLLTRFYLETSGEAQELKRFETVEA
jgi:xanthine dehydrogenase small subunit